MFTSTANILILNTGLVDGLSCFPEAVGLVHAGQFPDPFVKQKVAETTVLVFATLGIPFRKDFVGSVNPFLSSLVAVIGQAFIASGCGWSRQLNVYSVSFSKCFDMFTTALYTVLYSSSAIVKVRIPVVIS